MTFNRVNTYEWYRERVYHVEDEDHDPSDREAAWAKAQEWGPPYQSGSSIVRKTFRVARIRWPRLPAAIRLAVFANLPVAGAGHTTASRSSFANQRWRDVATRSPNSRSPSPSQSGTA
ncbi:MAG TPA: hypothetical protein VGR43_10285 [Dehalococcoidia bacterium]|nr:hypothetical protein [Dehalococcoidia bacterium]